MHPKKRKTAGSFRARLDQIINPKHAVLLAWKIDGAEFAVQKNDRLGMESCLR
jgi:hypothetical protein